jgi:hypothetical protein
MKKITLVLILTVLVVTMAMPVGAAGWTRRVSGGMSYADYGGVKEFTVTLSAWEKADGTCGGEGEYYYEPNGQKFHLDITKVCFGMVSSGTYAGAAYAVGIGTVRAQDDGTFGGYGAIAIAEGGETGDGIRVLADMAENDPRTSCTYWVTNTGFPALVLDGNFNIRSK